MNKEVGGGNSAERPSGDNTRPEIDDLSAPRHIDVLTCRDLEFCGGWEKRFAIMGEILGEQGAGGVQGIKGAINLMDGCLDWDTV